MSENILSTHNLVKLFGALPATDDLSISIETNEVHAIIGPNGAGKTTLLTQLAGQMKPTSGTIFYKKQDITSLSVVERVHLGLARSFQITSLWPDLTVLENIMLPVQAAQGHSFRFFRDAFKVSKVRQKTLEYLNLVGLESRAYSLVRSLSYGEQRQLELAVVLATGAVVLLLDEPLAGMGAEDSQIMVELLQRLKGQYTIVIVEHDMDAVFSLADRLSVLVYGKCIATGTPAEISANEEVQLAYLGEDT